VNCDRAQLVLSATMDGERVGARQADAAAAHAATCARCQAFAERSARIRTSVRIRAAEPVPDLVEPIMAAVARERVRPPRTAGVGPARAPRPRHRRAMVVAPAVAAAIAGMVVGSLLVGGPWQRPTDGPIAAATVVRGVRGVAPTLTSFRGTYTIDEFGLAPDVPERHFEMDVAFRSPQRFRLAIEDRTAYPSRSWTPTNLLYVEDVARTYVSGPSGCPGDLPPDVCPRTRVTVTRVSEYSAAAPLPADLVVPVATFGSARGIAVLGRDRIDGRDAIRLRLSFERAAPLFPFLRIGGTWRPFFDRDRVELWLDAATWLPLRTTVFPSASAERRAWELRFGHSPESPSSPVLDVRLASVAEGDPDPTLFAIPGVPAPPTPSLAQARARLGYRPSIPGDPGDLRLASIVLPAAAERVTPTSLLVFTEGLDYLNVGERRDWTGPGPFGPIDAAAQQVSLRDGGVAYYEPAGEGFGRRLAIHTNGADVFLETNLPRARLLTIASSLPVVGRRLPRAWGERVGTDVEVERVGAAEGLRLAGLAPSVNDALPGGYVVASGERSVADDSIVGVTLQLRQPEMDAAGEPMTLHVEPRPTLPAPTAAAQSVVRFAGIEARWTPSRSELEWLRDGVYHSLQGDTGLRTLTAIARAIARAEA
jgi:hypothetical protein